ncbi:MAG: hypothetical protein LQ350_006201 [Teloschistes chrysophthalmus]|nr:MAG: hypothetical protein LQ350_006201 [Niorma chrysophthalma]
MADLNNGWTVEIRDGKEPNQEVEPALEGLGISYDTGVEGRDNTQDQPFTDKDGNGNQPATKGFYITAFLTNGGTIIAENNRSPARQAPGAKIPPLWRWSDVTWLQWSTLAGARAAGLRYIIQDNIYTELTRYVIEHIEMAVPPLYDLDLPWPGHLYNAQSQQALMLLGSPHGIGVAWMLADHKDVLGIRYPWARIYTQPNDNPDRSGREYDYFLVWELRDTAT